jgi:hypothetical protein
VTARRKPRLVGPRVHLCLSDMRSGPRDDCPNEVHDFPLPSGYGDASEAAERRLRKRWANVQCPDCGLYGWRPGRPDRRPVRRAGTGERIGSCQRSTITR